jgi:phosphate transport system ATP-binding protein
MVFQKPNPFPKSIYNNVAYGLQIQARFSKASIHSRVRGKPEGSLALG